MATIKYYTYLGGNYTEDPEGVLVGVEWVDGNGNGIRAILFLMDFSTLRDGNEISFIYQVEVQPLGITNWLLRDRKTFRISNSVRILPTDDLNDVFNRLGEAPEIDPSAIGQLDYFVGLYLKGDQVLSSGTLPPMYSWLATIIADLEGQTIV